MNHRLIDDVMSMLLNWIYSDGVPLRTSRIGAVLTGNGVRGIVM